MDAPTRSWLAWSCPPPRRASTEYSTALTLVAHFTVEPVIVAAEQDVAIGNSCPDVRANDGGRVGPGRAWALLLHRGDTGPAPSPSEELADVDGGCAGRKRCGRRIAGASAQGIVRLAL